MIDPAWLPPVPMRRVIWHWPAGTHTPNETDRRAYHLLIDGDGRWHRGAASIALNSGGIRPGYAAHTKDCNSDSIGVALCGMGGATEVPFNAGRWPIRPVQVDALVEGMRQIGAAYTIPVTRKTMLSHAEVQTTLGIAQNRKWYWSRLPDDVTTLRGALAIGDWIRGRISQEAPMADPIPAGGTVRVTASVLLTRNGPGGEVTGRLGSGTTLTVLDQDGDWLHVQTPGGFKVWASRDHLELIDGPRPIAPTAPNPIRAHLDAIRKRLDQIEANL